MRRPVACWIAVFGLVSSSQVLAKDRAKQPPELMATISLGLDPALDGLRAFADAVRPGIGASLGRTVVSQQLGKLAEADSLDGLDPSAPTYVLIVDGGASRQGIAVVGRVRDDKLLEAGRGGAELVVDKGWAVIGSKAVVATISPYALATLPSRPAVTSPTAEIFVPQVLARYHTEIDAARKKLGATQGSRELEDLLKVYLDGTYAAIADCDAILATVDGTKDLGALDLALVPRAGSRLAKFVAAQRPSEFALLARLPASPGPFLFAGHLDAGPYRASILEMMAMMYGHFEAKDMIDAISAIMKGSTGELAASMQIGGGTMATTQLFAMADHNVLEKSLHRLVGMFDAGRTFDTMGISVTIKTNSTPIEHDGVVVRSFDATYDFGKAPEPTRIAMKKMIPTGIATMRVAAVDQLCLVSFGGSDPIVAIDASRGKAGFTPSPALAELVKAAVARRDSLLAVIDLGGLPGLQGPSRTMILSAGFADRAAHIRITLPVTTARSFAGTKP